MFGSICYIAIEKKIDDFGVLRIDLEHARSLPDEIRIKRSRHEMEERFPIDRKADRRIGSDPSLSYE